MAAIRNGISKKCEEKMILKKTVCILLTALILISLCNVNVNAKTTDKAAGQDKNTEGSTAKADSGPQIEASYTRHNGVATVVWSITSSNEIVSVKYLRGSYKSVKNSKWSTKAKDITKKSSFKVKKAGTYSIMAEDSKGRKSITRIKVEPELRAVWIAYYDFSDSAGMNETDFTGYVRTMFDNCVNAGMNAVMVHVRPYGDAMYPSKYFPWSKYASGTQGVNPGYDPLAIMIEEAHARNLEFHAWLNPYRVTASTTDVSYLSEDNKARIWRTNSKTSDDRNVLAYGKQLYYNPAKSAVRKLIINGIKEIVANYDVDGIHFDDYFYPDWLGDWPTVGGYDKVFDYVEYEEYVAKCKQKNKTPMDIVKWRQENVNKLIRGIYKAVKEINPEVVFGISPGGFLDYLIAENRYYVDFPTWMSTPGYIDYICPQLYWSFDPDNVYPYDTTLDRWLEYRTLDSVEVYCGLGLYKATLGNTGSNEVDKEWGEKDILARMIKYGRNTKSVGGYIIFDYSDLISSVNAKTVDEMEKMW